MTLDEARVIVEKHYWSQYAISKIAAAIVSAVSAERRAALTEAAEVCNDQARRVLESYPKPDSPEPSAYRSASIQCADAIAALRDKL